MRATLLFAVVQLITIRSTPLGILRLRDRFSLSALADSMTPLVRFVGAGLALALLPTVEGFLLAWAAAELVTAGAYWIILARTGRSEEHTSELQSLMRISYAVFCLKKKKIK